METKVHQIKIDFYVTSEIKRYVYVYLIEKEFCYLIDAGVAGSEKIIEHYMQEIGRELSEIRAVFLTHAHPDHIGSAAVLKEISGCKIYASEGERRWIEDIDLQFEERPIPNFYALAGRSVQVDEVKKDGDVVELEAGLSVRVIGTPGHSCEELSYLLPEVRCIFTGDAIPVRGDIPIWILAKENRESLKKLEEIEDVDFFYPAWDVTYDRMEAKQKIRDAVLLMDEIQQSVDLCRKSGKSGPQEDIAVSVCEQMQTPQFLANPLFRRTVQSML